MTLLFRAHGTSVLLTGDIGVDEERTMINEELLSDIDVLQVPHHGGNTSTSQALLEVTKPEVAIISVGQNNDYGHPHMDVLERIVSFGATVWRTDVHGDVRIKITENGYRVSGHAL